MVHLFEDGIMSNWIPITIVCGHNDSNKKNSFTIEQFPFQLACAWTIHRSQGLTMDRLAFDPNGVRKHGLVYITLYHVKDIKSLYFLNKLEHIKFSLSDKVVVELQRLRVLLISLNITHIQLKQMTIDNILIEHTQLLIAFWGYHCYLWSNEC